MQRNNWLQIALLLIAASGCSTPAPKQVAAPAAPATTEAAAPPPAPVTMAPESAPPKSVQESEQEFPAAAAVQAAPATAAMPAPSVMAGGPSQYGRQASAPHIPARDYCLPNDSCERGYAAYGYILFTKKPTPNSSTMKRYKAICEAFAGNLVSTSELIKNHEDPQQFATTFWLLKAKPAKTDDCDELIANYDYARATRIATSIKKLASAGPLLVAKAKWSDPQPNQKMLLIDLGKFAQDELDSAFRIWRDDISKDQRFWNDGFNMKLIVVEFKSFIQKYGDKIVQLVTPS